MSQSTCSREEVAPMVHSSAAKNLRPSATAAAEKRSLVIGELLELSVKV